VYPPAIASQIPIICIPTSLSGGEYSVYSGTTDDETHTKYQFCPPLKSPSLIILSGAVARTTPLDIWLQSGIRGVDHCVEALCSTISTEEVDKSATKGLQCLIPGLLKTKNDPNDEDTRHECQLGIMYAMLPLHRLIPCGASHGIGHMLGPLGKVGHGETSCILLPAVCKYNAKHGGEDIRARQKTVREILWAIPVAKERFEKRGLKEGEADLGDLIDVVVRELGLKRSLKEANVGRDMFLKLAEISKADPFMETNPVPIKGPSQVMEILELCAE
jgi:alcohol dehydrogenase class IV